MFGRWRDRLACQTERGVQNRYSLKFANRGLEAGFAKHSTKKLLRNLQICCLGAIAGGSGSLIFAEPWDVSSDRYASEQEQDIMQTSNIMFGACVLYALLVFVICCLPCTANNLTPCVMEATTVFLLCSGIVLLSLCMPYQLGHVLGYDPQLYLAKKHISDTGLLLSIDAMVTASHMVLPVRFWIMWPVEVTGILCYLAYAFVFGTAEPENVPQYLSALVALVLMAAVGKRNQESSDRAQFMNLMEEKSTRFQAEFQLAKIQERQEAQGVARTPSMKSRSESGLESLPSTTESARQMMPRVTTAADEVGDIDAGFLRNIATIGEKEQWLIQPGEMSILPRKLLGEGGFGLVLGGLYQGVEVAIKVPKNRGHGIASQSHLTNLCNELRILRRLRHPNVVFLYGACLDEQGYYLALVLEFVRGIPLDSFILPWRRNAPVEQQQQPEELGRSQVLLDVSCALRYLHSRSPHIVHGDLKGSNVFVEEWKDTGVNARAKLLDFGLSRMLTRNALPMGGTLAWMAPEILQGKKTATSTETDVFSFGRLANFVLSGRRPFGNLEGRGVEKMLRSKRLPPMHWPENGFLVERYRLIVEECCDVNPQSRPRMSHVHRNAGLWHDQLRGLQTPVFEASEPLDVGKLVCGPREAMPDHSPDINELMTASAQLQEGETTPSPGPDSTGTAQMRAGRASSRSDSPKTGRLEAVPEERACSSNATTGLPQGFTPNPLSQGATSTVLAFPLYARTPDDTLMAMIMEILMSCNLKIQDARCCLFHATLKSLIQAARGLQTRLCSNQGLGSENVVGQCPGCGILIRSLRTDSQDCPLSMQTECSFCEHELRESHSL